MHSNDRTFFRSALVAALALVCAVAGAQAILPAAKPKAAKDLPQAHKPDAKEAGSLAQLRQERMRGYIENKGQWPSDALFVGRSNGLDLWVAKDGLRLDAYNKASGSVSGHVVGIKFLGAKPLASKGYEPKGILTDFLGHFHDVRSAKTFVTVKSNDLYPGISLKNYFDNTQPRYDLVVAPHANASQIRMNYVATKGLKIQNNKLSIKTTVGDIVENKLVAYQMVDGKKKVVRAAFRSIDKNTVGFTLGSYDHSKTLIIDPVLIYGSYYGGDSGMDEVHAVVADQVGGVYLTGSTRAIDFPIIFGPYSFALNNGLDSFNTLSNPTDGFVSKLEGDAYKHDYAVFLGGSNDDSGDYLQLDQFGDLWVEGSTTSKDFPGMGSTPNVEYLTLDSNFSEGKGPTGHVLIPQGVPNTNGSFLLNFQGTLISTPPIPWNVTSGQLQTILQTYLANTFPGQTVQVIDRTGADNLLGVSGNGEGSRGFEIVFSPGVNKLLHVSNNFLDASGLQRGLGAIYDVKRDVSTSGSSRAQIIIHDPQSLVNPPSQGDFVLTLSYSRGGGNFTATTDPISFDAKAPVIQDALNAIHPDPSDPNQSPVLTGVVVKPDNQTFIGQLPGNAMIVVFKAVEPVMNLVPASQNEVQEVNISGATSGTFTLNPLGLGVTAAIPFNATAAQVQADLEAVMGVGNVLVTSPAPQIFDIHYVGSNGGVNEPQVIANFTALVGGVKTVTTIIQGAQGINGQLGVIFAYSDKYFWNSQSSIPSGPGPSNNGVPPIPDPNGGVFNIQYGGTWANTGGAFNATPQQLNQAISSANMGGEQIVVPDNGGGVGATMPGTSMTAVYINDFLQLDGNTASPPKASVSDFPVFTGSIIGDGPYTEVAAGRIYPSPGYMLHEEAKEFVMRFKQDATTVLNPLPTKSFIFGGDVAPVMSGFKIIPHDNPIAGEPIRLAFSGTAFQQPQLVPEVPGQPRALQNQASFVTCGFVLRVNYTDAAGFSVQNASSGYIDAFDPNFGSCPVLVTGIDVDSNANIYVGGTIRGPSGLTIDTAVAGATMWPTTSVDPNGSLNNGRLIRSWDGFVRKYSSTGALTYSVLIGGTAADEGFGVAVDPNGDAYLLGRSRSFDYPRTRGVYGETFTQATVSTIAKLNPNATDLIYCTHLRTVDTVTPVGIAVDPRGIAYATLLVSRATVFHEWTPTNDPNLTDAFQFIGSVPVTSDALLSTYSDNAPGGDYGATDGALLVLNPTATNLLYGTYLGGGFDDFFYPPYVDKGGDCWVCGWTDTFRAYARPHRWSVGVTVFKGPKRVLPNTMITSLAFRPTPDPNNNHGGPGTQNLPWQLYNNELSWDPIFWGAQMYRDRDGWVGRFRIGLAAITSVSFSPSTIPGGLGAATTGVVTLNQPAPAGGAFISLTMSASAPASFDPSSPVTSSSIVIPAGQTTGAFTVYSNPVTDNTPVDVTATFQGNFHVGRVVVVPWLSSLSVSPQDVVGGNAVSARIQLAGVAGSGGINVTLTSDNTTVVPLTGVSGTVPPGQNSVAVQIPTNGVDADTTVTLNASLLGVGKAFQLVVHPVQLKALSMSPNPVTSGSPSTGTLTLNGKTGPQGFKVNLSVQGAPTGYTITPNVLTFTAGQTQQTFQVSTPYESQTVGRVIVAAMQPTLGYTPNTINTTLNVVADGIVGLQVTPSPIAGGSTATGQVTLSTPALAGGAKVNISVSPSNGVVTVPSQIIVPAGQTSASFSIPTTTLINNTTFTITATRGTSSSSATLQVTALTFTISIPSVIPPSSSGIGTIQLSGPAPAGGIAVTLTSSAPTVLSVPNTIVISAGNSSVNFPITTFGITSDTAVTVTAKIGTTTHTASTTVQASKLTSMTLNPSYVLNLTTSKCSLFLSGPAPAGGMVVHFTNSNPLIASVPSTVTVPAGASSYSFSIITLRVTRTLQTVITASGPNGGAASATLTVHN